jgi:phosphoenolpyruvate carboxykinase (ATP)
MYSCPRNTWKDKDAYDKKAEELAGMFKRNFDKFSEQASKELIMAGPVFD